MGIRFYCPNGHKLNVKAFQAGRKGICPYCGSKIQIPLQSTRKSGKNEDASSHPPVETTPAPAATAGFSSESPGGDLPPGTAEAPVSPATESAPVAAAASSPAPAGQPSPAQPAQTSHAVIPQQSAPVTPVSESAPVSSPQAAAPAAPVPPAEPPGGSGASAAVPRHPLSEGGDVVWYVRPPSGGQFGPASPDVMRGWIDQGRVSAESLVWREGWQDWQEAATVFPQLGAGQERSPFGQILPGVGGAETGQTAGPASHRARSRRQSQTIQVAVVSVLIIAVAVLLGVFLWILNENEPPAEENTRASVPAATVAWQPASAPNSPQARP